MKQCEVDYSRLTAVGWSLVTDVAFKGGVAPGTLTLAWRNAPESQISVKLGELGQDPIERLATNISLLGQTPAHRKYSNREIRRYHSVRSGIKGPHNECTSPVDRQKQATWSGLTTPLAGPRYQVRGTGLYPSK